MKKYFLLILMVLFLSNSAFAYKKAQVILYGDKSGSVTIQTYEANALMGAIMSLYSGSSANVNTTLTLSYNNFKNKGQLIKGGFYLKMQGSGSLTKSSISGNGSGVMIFDGGPVYYGNLKIIYNNLTYNLNANSKEMNCTSGSLIANGSTISCDLLNQKLKNSGALLLLISIL